MNAKKLDKSRKGFTLVELLIVILLIGLLSGVLTGVINIRGIRAKSRDSQRIADLNKIRTALELYFSDKRAYPASDNPALPANWETVANTVNLAPPFVGSYINNMPTDPLSTGASSSTSVCAAANTSFDYWYFSQGSRYILATNMEVLTSDDASMCANLRNWTSLGCGAISANTNCYGVENPF